MARIHYHHLNRLLLDASAAAPPPSATGPKTTDNSYAADANFDSNMVIILAALLCALICALGLNSMMRCFVRCSQRFSPFEEENNPDRVGSRTGLKKEALSQIPVAAYEAGGMGIQSATECTICLGEFVEGEKVRVLPRCRHGFHVKCIDAWLDSHSSCPICRQLLLFEGAGNSGSQRTQL